MMPTISPSPKQINRKIADVLEEKFCACKTPAPFHSPPAVRNTLCCGKCKGLIIPIDRATDRNASYELPVEGGDRISRFPRAVLKIAQENSYRDLRLSAYIESLGWLLYKGWRTGQE